RRARHAAFLLPLFRRDRRACGAPGNRSGDRALVVVCPAPSRVSRRARRRRRGPGPLLALRGCGVDLPLSALLPGEPAVMNSPPALRVYVFTWVGLMALLVATFVLALLWLGAWY